MCQWWLAHSGCAGFCLGRGPSNQADVFVPLVLLRRYVLVVACT